MRESVFDLCLSVANSHLLIFRHITPLVLISGLFICGCTEQEIDRRPNIVIILADDFGVGDIQSHFPNGKIPSPYLDQFTEQSMRFTNAHSGSAVCTPTRYGLLTGRYAWRTRLQEWVLASYEPPLIAEDRLTLPKFLQNHGYATACIGKWHLGWNWPGPQPSTMEEEAHIHSKNTWYFDQPITGGPTERGFDNYFGVHLPNMPPFTFIKNDRIVEQPTARFEYDPYDGRFMPRIFDGNPIAPDWKLDQILPEITKRAVSYIHEQAQEDEPFFLYFPMTSPHTPIVPSEPFIGKSGISSVADFIMETDWSAGQVIQSLEDAGIADDTLVIFTSDNGHLPQGWDDLIEVGHEPSGPYRGRKAEIWEGGHRIPLLVRWPGNIQGGIVNDDLLSLNDIFATCADILDTVLSNDVAEDSFSFLPTLLGESETPYRDHLVSHSVGGEFAYTEEGWKLVYRNETPNRDQSRGKPRILELYHLAEDIAETTNLIDQEPERAEQLRERLDTVVSRGTSRDGPDQSNDTNVEIETTQMLRWGPPIN